MAVKIYNNGANAVFEETGNIRDYNCDKLTYNIKSGVVTFFYGISNQRVEQLNVADVQNKSGGTFASDLLLSEYLSFFLTQNLELDVNITNNPDVNVINNPEVKVSNFNLDAFSRLRISNPVTVFDSQFTYDLQPLLFEQIITGVGGTITHDATNRCASINLTTGSLNARSYLQSFEHIRYQPSKSQLGFISFNFVEHVTGCRKFVGYGDIENNAIQFRQRTDGTYSFNILSDTSEGDVEILRANWNLDKLDGTGASGIDLDFTKTQLFVFDFQALYVGTVRFGFSIGGDIIYAHEEHHTNISTNPYIQSANLPVIAGMRAVSTAGITTSMKFICSAIVSEGGQDETTGYDFAQSSGAISVSNGVDTHVLSLRPSLTFNGITNRVKFIDFEYEIAVRGNSAIEYKIVLGQALSGTTAFINHNATYSAMDYNILGTLSGSPAIIVDSGEVFSSASQKGGVTKKVSFRYPITLDYLGAVRSLGTISLIAQGIGGNTTVRGILKWREVR